jgi:glucuronate isomerase
MREYVHDDFLLKTAIARRLFHEYAERLPIIDYHGHLDARVLAENRPFANLAQAWIVGDPYKHRAMRMVGVPERLITGTSTDREKFDVWAATVPRMLGNPLYAWTALELKRFFAISEPLSPENANNIWETANAALRTPEFLPRRLLSRANVECLCTSDGLLADLDAHATLAQSGFATRVLPSLRGDDVLAVESPDYADWMRRLASAIGVVIDSVDAFEEAVARRLDAFGRLGCRLADHALDDFAYDSVGRDDFASLFQRRLDGDAISTDETKRLRSALLGLLGACYGRRGWVMPLHLGAQRRTSTRLAVLAGPAGGYATIGNSCDVASLCRFLDDLERRESLPRTILYPLNPADNAALATLTGSFAEDGVGGKIQCGPAWWYNDHALGIRRHLETLANYGLLSTFIGMTTDSRSLLSMARHEYFRRVLCDYLGELMENGELPDDFTLVGRCVQDIAYNNARRWFVPKGA